MFVIVDARETVAGGFAALFRRQGIAASGISPDDLGEWVGTAQAAELAAVEAVLVAGPAAGRDTLQLLRARLDAAVIAVLEDKSLDETLSLFAAGADDVVRKPIHAREVMARVAAIRRRGQNEPEAVGEIVVHQDGRDPIVGGSPLPLPRRERRILELLMAHRGCRLSKSQIFNAVYGLFSEDIDESVVESHVSKLRKRLRQRLGYDPIDCQRFLGYRLDAVGTCSRPSRAA